MAEQDIATSGVIDSGFHANLVPVYYDHTDAAGIVTTPTVSVWPSVRAPGCCA